MSMRSVFFDTSRQSNSAPSWPARLLNLSLAFLAAVSVFYFAFSQLTYHWAWDSVSVYWYKFLQGWIVTVLISLAALVTSFSIGVLFALAQRSSLLLLRYLSKMYVEAVRGHRCSFRFSFFSMWWLTPLRFRAATWLES
jgi:ABC-type amino acid transport system permease subunit